MRRAGALLAALGLVGAGGCAGLGCEDEGGGGPRPPVPPDVVLISLDTVRQDRGPGPWGEGIMPAYARFAAGADRYAQAWAPSSNTLVSHGSLFTGLYPWQHGFHPELAAPADPPDLMPRLKARGYHVAVFTTHPTWLGAEHGFNAGAEVFRSEAVPGEEVLRWVKAWLADPPPRPRALFVHLYDAHSDTHHHPYEAPELPPEAAAFAGCVGEVCASKLLRAVDSGQLSLPEGAPEAVRAGYDAGVAHVDALLGQLLGEVEPLMGDGLVAVFADHGELLGEDGAWLHHGGQPEVLDIPLAVRRPEQEVGTVVDAPVSLVDLYGTVLEAAGVPDPAKLSLSAAVRGTRGRAVAMGAARLGDRMAFERPGGAVSYLRRQPSGAWAPAEEDPRLAHLATNPVEAVIEEDLMRLDAAERP